MKSFREYLSEEVLPSALVADGSIDIEKSSVRGAINAALAGVTAQPTVTPYVSLHHISKLLAQYHIILPKRAYLEGDRGVEVYEIRQFGDRMGMTDQAEFIHSVPSKFYLYIQYSTHTPLGVTYAKPTVGGMFRMVAKLVDQNELENLVSMAEVMMKEDAEQHQKMAKSVAPKEPMHDIDDPKRAGSKSAVDTSMRKSDKKLSADSLDEAMTRKQKDMAVRRFMSHDPDAGERILAMGKKERGEKKSFASAKKEIKRLKEEEQIDELKKSTLGSYIKKAHVSGLEAASKGEIAYARKDKEGLRAANKTGEKREQGIERAANKLSMKESRMPASVIAHKQKLASMSPEELKKKFAGKSEEHLKSMARRHGYGKDSDVYSKHIKEDTVEESAKKKEKFEKISKAFKDVPGQTRGERDSGIMSSMGKQKETVHRGEIRRALKKHLYGDKNKKVDKDVKDAKEKAKEKMYWPKGRPVREENLDEKTLTPAETRKKEELVMKMKKGLPGFKKRYGERAKEVMYATATKRAKQVAEKLEFDPSTEVPRNT